MSYRDMFNTPHMGMRLSPMIPVTDKKMVDSRLVGQAIDKGDQPSAPRTAMRPKRMLLSPDKGLVEISPARCGGNRI